MKKTYDSKRRFRWVIKPAGLDAYILRRARVNPATHFLEYEVFVPLDLPISTLASLHGKRVEHVIQLLDAHGDVVDDFNMHVTIFMHPFELDYSLDSPLTITFSTNEYDK